ncbi:MAG: hypothetical protein RLZZ361_1248 [Cyanobacteriota bacterium]
MSDDQKKRKEAFGFFCQSDYPIKHSKAETLEKYKIILSYIVKNGPSKMNHIIDSLDQKDFGYRIDKLNRCPAKLKSWNVMEVREKSGREETLDINTDTTTYFIKPETSNELPTKKKPAGIDWINSEDYEKIFKFDSKLKNRLLTRENDWLEFKESFNWNSKDKYAKSIAGMSNNYGGYIIFGVKDQPKDLVGLKNDSFDLLDEEKVTEFLNDAFSPEIKYEKFTIQINKLSIGIIKIHESSSKPIVAIKNQGDIQEACIYYRYSGRTDKIKYPELVALLEKVKTEERSIWKRFFEKMLKTDPSNIAIMDIVKGDITGSSQTLLIDDQLASKLKFIQEGTFKEGGEPVLKLVGEVMPMYITNNESLLSETRNFQITDDPSAPRLQLSDNEIKKTHPLDFQSLTKILQERYSNFKYNQQYHELRKKLSEDKQFCLRRYLDPDNLRSSKKDFYSKAIVKEFDKYYKKKKK